MKSPRYAIVRRSTRLLSLLTASIFTVTPPVLRAAIESWNNFTGTGLWSLGSNWADGTAPLPNDPTLDLIFGATGAQTYTSNNDLIGALLNTITLNSSSTGAISLTGNSLDFRLDGADLPAIAQNGTGAVSISNALIATDPLNFGGTGSGLVALTGLISGGGAVTFNAANWQLSSTVSTYSGGTTVNAAARVEIVPIAGGTSVSFATGGSSVLGSNASLTLDGGALKLTTASSGTITLGAARPVTFGTNGGTIDLTNSNNVSATTQGGNIAGGDLLLTLNNALASPAVIKWNGGQLGLSANSTTGNAWDIATNTLRIAANGAGPLRIELTNGALLRGNNGGGTGDNNFTMPLTVRGTVGGDPTSGPAGTVNSGIARTLGRIQTDVTRINYNGGVTYEGALQINNANRSAALNGNLTVASNGYVAFQGRGSGTAVSSLLHSPGTGTAGNSLLWIGENPATTLTVQNGGVALFDARLRADQNYAHGLLLGGNAVLNAGGTLRIQQSLSNFSNTGSLTTTNYVADIILRGSVTGEGSTAAEAVLSIALPAPDFGGSASSGVPTPLPDTAPTGTPAATARPFGGLVAEEAHQLVVNGTDFGGLRVIAVPRPDRLFSVSNAPGGAAMPDPTPTTTKLDSYLTPTRLAAITGSGGYLTPAATGAAWTFPAGGEWGAAVPVGLRVIDSNAGGADVVMGPAAWNHNVVVDAGATLDTGGALFTMGSGTLSGKGTVAGPSGISIGAGATVAPGTADIGTLNLGNITINGTVRADVALLGNDKLAITGNLTFGAGSTLQIAPGSTFNNSDYTLITYSGTRSNQFTSILGLPVGYSVNYDLPGQVRLVSASAQARIWNGTPGGNWSTAAGDANWKGPASFNNGDTVTFDDTAAGTTTVTLTTPVFPGAITFANSTKNYVLSGSGANIVQGVATLIKNGTGILEVQGAHTYIGGTTINAGTLRLGANDTLPDTGTVSVAAGATLDVNGKTETVGTLAVTGTVTAGTIMVGGLTLQDGASVLANLVLNGDAAKNGIAPVTLGASVNLGAGNRTFTVATGTAPELTINGVLSNGSLTKDGPGTLRLTNTGNAQTATTVNGGTLVATTAGALSSGNVVGVGPDGTLDLGGLPRTLGVLTTSGITMTGGAALTLSSLAGGNAGSLILDGGLLTLNQATASSFGGAISGTGTQVIKNGAGVLSLSGPSSFDGGLIINAGRVNLGHATAAGTGPITVASGMGLQLGAETVNNITLNGGILSSQLANNANGGLGELNVPVASTINLINRDNNGVADLVFNGVLRGPGNLNVVPSSGQANADQGQGFRLRGADANNPSNYSGTLTVNQRVKFEIQMGNSSGVNPFGTGKILLIAGTTNGVQGSTLGELGGTYPQIQPRLVSGGQTYLLNNDIQISGSGYVNVNVLGGTDVVAQFGELRIGGGQILAANKNDANNRTLAFTTVKLTGGNSEFRAFDFYFGQAATTTRGGANIRLNDVTELVPGAGLILRATAPYVNEIAGISIYSGPTTVESGTLVVSGSLSGTTAVNVKAGALAGTGTIAAPVFVGDNLGVPASATLAPGTESSIGTLTTGGLTLANADARFKLELNSFDLLHDQLAVNGILTLGAGIAALEVTDLGFGTLENGESFVIATATGGISGFFANQPQGSAVMVGSNPLTISYLSNQIVLTAIPEPGALSLLLMGSIALLGSLRARQRQG